MTMRRAGATRAERHAGRGAAARRAHAGAPPRRGAATRRAAAARCRAARSATAAPLRRPNHRRGPARHRARAAARAAAAAGAPPRPSRRPDSRRSAGRRRPEPPPRPGAPPRRRAAARTPPFGGHPARPPPPEPPPGRRRARTAARLRRAAAARPAARPAGGLAAGAARARRGYAHAHDAGPARARPGPSRTSQPSARSSSRSRSASAQSLSRRAWSRSAASSTASSGGPSLGGQQPHEPEHVEHLAQVRVADRLLRAVRLADPAVQRRQRLGRVEVVAQRVEERVPVRRQRIRRRAGHEPPSRVPDPLRGALRVLQPLVGERQRLPVVAGAQEQHEHLAADVVEHVAEPADVPDRLRHLLGAQLEHPVVHPDPRQRLPARGQRLRRLVLVVREHEVDAAAVDVELDAQQRLGHRRALDVPARPPRPPRRVPGRVLALLRRLPQREIERIVLEIRALDALALVHLVDVPARQLAVGVERADAEVDVPGHRVGRVGVDQPLDQLDDLAHVLRRVRLGVRPPEPEPVGVGDVMAGHLVRQLLRGPPGGPRRVVDLVVDVGDVADQHDAVALVLEEPLELREDHERPRVADVHARVDRRAAGVDPHARRIARLERLQGAGSGVVERDVGHGAERTHRAHG